MIIQSLKELALGLFEIWLYLPFPLQVMVGSAIASFFGWLIAKWLSWVWNKNDDRGIGHAGRMRRFATANGWDYVEVPNEEVVKRFSWLPHFATGHDHQMTHLLRKKSGDLEQSVFLFTREQSAKAGWAGEFFTVVHAFRLAGSAFPDLMMLPGRGDDLPDEVVVDEDLARVYTIRASEKHGVYKFFTPGLIESFIKTPDWCVSVGGEYIALWRPMRCETAEAHGRGIAGEPLDPATFRMPLKELPKMIDDSREVFGLIAAAAGRSVVTAEQRSITPRRRREMTR